MKTPCKALFVSLLCALSILTGTALFQESVMAQDEAPGKLIETFTLTKESPSRSFFEGKLKVELTSATVDEVFKRVQIRVSSRALRAEYARDWEEHTYLEQLKHYVGDPFPRNPFKCAEGWLYYEKSEDGGVTISLRANPHMADASSYSLLLLLLENWKKVVIGLGLIALAFFLYYYAPLFWSFVSIQHLAHVHALQTGFPSSPVLIYLIKRLPLILFFGLFIHVLFNYGWKGVVAGVLMAVGLQLYLNWHNTKQLQTYAALKGMAPITESKNQTFQGQVNGVPIALTVGGHFVWQSESSFLSYMVMEVSLNSSQWEGLDLNRDFSNPDQWESNRSIEFSPRIKDALAHVSRLSKYSITQFTVKNQKLLTSKLFAPDTPAEINLLVDLVTNVAVALNSSRPATIKQRSSP